MTNLAHNITDLAPGVYQDIPAEVYHNLTDYVSNSYLSRLDKCPAAAKVTQEETAALLFGRAAHCFILEGEDTFFAQFAVAPDCDKRTKDGKALWANFQAAKSYKAIISKEDFEAVDNMHVAVNQHPFARRIIAAGVSEQTVIWQDEQTGLMCRCRPDRVPDGGRGVLVDLKTTENADADAFLRSALKYGYVRQAAYYLDGMSIASREAHDLFAFIAVEKKPPYRVEVYTLAPDFIDYGREDYRRLLGIERQCRERGYPHYVNDGPVTLNKPGWL